MSGKVAAFAHYGVKLTNNQQSWSGLAPNGDVVVGLWKDEFHYDSEPPFYQPNPNTNDIWKDKPGNRERIKHLVRARDALGGRFRVVVMTAKDTNADPREVHEAYASKNLIMQLVELNEETGVFRAHLVRT